MELAEDEDDESMLPGKSGKSCRSWGTIWSPCGSTTLLTGEWRRLQLHSVPARRRGRNRGPGLDVRCSIACTPATAERMGFAVKVLDLLEGDEAGIKSVSFEVTGDYAYGYLKCETRRAPAGAHLPLRRQRPAAYLLRLHGRFPRHRRRR